MGRLVLGYGLNRKTKTPKFLIICLHLNRYLGLGFDSVVRLVVSCQLHVNADRSSVTYGIELEPNVQLLNSALVTPIPAHELNGLLSAQRERFRKTHAKLS